MTALAERALVETESGALIAECDTRGWGGGMSLASADYECRHGRLPGDECPQPRRVPGPLKGSTVPNPSRLWAHPYPCGCWPSELPALSTLTPKGTADALPAPREQIAVLVIRHPDCENDITVFGADALVIDVDYGRSDLSDPDEYAEWRESHVGKMAALRARGLVEIAAAYEVAVDKGKGVQ